MFGLPKAETQRLGTLMITACLAYLPGVSALRNDQVKLIHRSDRFDSCLSRLGLALLDYFLNEEFIYPDLLFFVGFKSVR
jgi:hypothetical protein